MALAPIFKELTESRPESKYSNWQKSTEFLLRSSNKSAVSNTLFVIIKQEPAGLWFHHTHNKEWKTPVLVLQCSYLGTNVEIFGRQIDSFKDLAMLEDLEHKE